jgi:hypothetical protein
MQAVHAALKVGAEKWRGIAERIEAEGVRWSTLSYHLLYALSGDPVPMYMEHYNKGGSKNPADGRNLCHLVFPFCVRCPMSQTGALCSEPLLTKFHPNRIWVLLSPWSRFCFNPTAENALNMARALELRAYWISHEFGEAPDERRAPRDPKKG